MYSGQGTLSLRGHPDPVLNQAEARMSPTQGDADYVADNSAFRKTIGDTFGDKRIVGYFDRGLVDHDQVAKLLAAGDAFDQARRLNSYQVYNSIRERMRRKQNQPRSIKSMLSLRAVLNRASDLSYSRVNITDLSKAMKDWLDDSIEEVIIPNTILAINTILGNDQDKLLVEQDSEGLRRLQDPAFRVPTRTRERLTSLLSQMDGGSVAVAGLRGAGKSTLLKQFCLPLDDDIRSARTIAIYVPAPSSYVARDFIAELFQRLCEAYLSYCDDPAAEDLYRMASSRIGRQQAVRKILRISWLVIRAAIGVTLLILVSWSLVTHSPFLMSKSPLAHHLARETVKLTHGWWRHYRAYFFLAIVLAAWAFWPPIRLWREYLRRTREADMIQRARENLLRLRVDKTVTRGTGVNSPSIQGLGLAMNRASSVKYTPWSLPELVSSTRRFMQDISLQMKCSSRPIVVAIDEIDRIGSLEDAEGFIGEIKAVFGVEGCYFLVAVAEDVGSLFAQRATAGRSILENAFDEIVAVGPLTLYEARSLLLKRVPGFTDAFVYLAYAMSGGLPRELIRVSRRLVEMNLEQLSQGDYPRLEDLTLALVTESVIDALDASRNQMSRLILRPGWAQLFDRMRSASVRLRRDRSSPKKLYEVIKEVDEMSLPYATKSDDAGNVKTTQEDEDAAARILNSLSAFAYFGITIVDAFSDRYFNLSEARQRTDSRADNGYEELAAARVELSVSYASARLILDRFRESLQPLHPGKSAKELTPRNKPHIFELWSGRAKGS
jgi:Cdc6-like AAA superfamily ATPase